MLVEFNNTQPKEYLYAGKDLYFHFLNQKQEGDEIIDYRLVMKDVERTKRKE